MLCEKHRFRLSKKLSESWAFSHIYDIIVAGDERCWNAEKWNEEFLRLWTLKVWCLQIICCGKLMQPFSAISYNFRHRFTAETVDEIFNWILKEMVEAGYVAPGVVFVDGTHIKANANLKKTVKEEVLIEAKRYAEELMEEVNADREAHGKKPFADDEDDDDNNEPPVSPKKKRDNTSKKKLKKRKKEAKKKTVTVSTTDPDCGLFVKGDHKKQLAYEAHTVCDVHGVVLDVEVTLGNVHDSVPFDDLYDRIVEKFPQVHAFVADSAYKTPHICKKVFGDDRVLSTAYKRPMTMKGGHECLHT